MAWFREVRAQVGGRMAQKLEAQKTTPVGIVEKKGGQRPRLFWWEKVDAPPRWHCQDGRRVGCIVVGQRAGGDRSAGPWALGQ